MIEAGAAIVDITPPPGMAMSGFAARSQPASGAHDALTARAIVIGDTAIVVVDVIGIDAATSARIRCRCRLPADNVIVAALHNHGGPVSMAGRLSIEADPTYLERLEDACVAAIDKAAASCRPASLAIGEGRDPAVARNRRHANGPVDSTLPVLRIRDEHGAMIAVVTAYACHPVVLAADNLLWTADYPHYVRASLEQSYPGCVALFLTGCTGDANTGHSAHASITLAANPDRSFEAAEKIGWKIGAAALAAPERLLDGSATAHNAAVQLRFERRETEPAAALAENWRREALTAEPARATLVGYWSAWAETIATAIPAPLAARVTVLDWCGVPIIALPGEIFAETALSIRASLKTKTPAFVIGFADDNPGYIPPASEFGFGGYEVDEAHRYYGMPMSFAPGSAEALARSAVELASSIRGDRGSA